MTRCWRLKMTQIQGPQTTQSRSPKTTQIQGGQTRAAKLSRRVLA
jgi:hypothetical protein